MHARGVDVADPLQSRDLGLASAAPGSRQTAHEYVRETLRQAILSGELKGNTRLVQTEIASELQVSITPVREALRDLANEQMIELDAHRGGIVHELTDGELQEILDLRLLLEVEAMRRAAERITPEQIEKARSFHEAMESAVASSAWVMLNRSFHMTIYEAAERPRLLAIIRNLLDSSMMYVSATDVSMPEHRAKAGGEHAAILQMLEAHDVEATVEAITGHINIPRSILRLHS